MWSSCQARARSTILGVDTTALATLALTAATLLLVGVTLLLWWEARRLRVEANVVAFAAPWEVAGGIYTAVLIENAGPAIARDVRVEWSLDRKVDAKRGSLGEPIFDVGFKRTIPMKAATLDQLAAEGASIRIDVTWRDGRRGIHRKSTATPCEEIRAAYVASDALPRPSLLEVLDQIRDSLRNIAKK